MGRFIAGCKGWELGVRSLNIENVVIVVLCFFDKITYDKISYHEIEIVSTYLMLYIIVVTEVLRSKKKVKP